MQQKITNTQNISGGTFHAPVGLDQTFSACYNRASLASQQEVQEALRSLISEVEVIYPQLGDAERDKAQKRLKTLTDAASLSEPDKGQIQFSGAGLIEAAKTCAEIAGPVVTATKALLNLFGAA